MYFKGLFLFGVSWILCISTVQAVQFALEAEHQSETKYMEVSRSNASSGKAVHLFKGDKIHLEFCLSKETLFQIKDVKYSNDGGDDIISVAVDNEPVRMFQTISVYDGGRGWNKYRSSGPWNYSAILSEGRHRISVSVLGSDSFGVEIDMLYIEMPDSNQDMSSFLCSVFCFDNIHYADDMSHQTITQAKAKIVQKSVKTNCAEEDNVNVPVFHEGARKFVVTASYPKYMSFSNNRGADWRNCQMSGPFWKFENFSLMKTLNLKSGTAEVASKWNGDKMRMDVEFSLEGPSTGSTDSEIGADIFFNFDWLPANADVTISLSYLDRYSHWSQAIPQQLNISSLRAEWRTPDFTFREGSGNRLRLEIRASMLQVRQVLKVKEFYMFKRHIEYDKSVQVFSDGMTIIEAVDMDMWWRINETMTLILDNGKIFGNVDYFRVYQRVPWSYNGFSQVFVMYQDGNVRLLPVTPHGLDWVPFGSSVLLGQTDPHSSRPSAPIAHVNINPANLNMKIFYKDGGIISLQINPTSRETKLVVSDAEYTQDLKLYPFFTFRSMWVANGNSDVDHVSVDGAVTKRILSGWKELSGTFVVFYRKCISQHNTLSPDISLKIID